MTGPTWTHRFSVDSADQQACRQLSGDENPLHHDPAFARRRGYAGPVVFGAAIVAKISGFLGSTFPGSGCVWSKLNVAFRAPLYVDQVADMEVRQTHANAELAIWELALSIHAGDTLVATGSVQVMRPAEKQ